MELIALPEPRLLFRDSQALEDPRDGLTLFGPLDEGSPFGIRSGVIGTQDGIALFKDWLNRIQGEVVATQRSAAHPPFPGFSTAFHVPWPPIPVHEITVNETEVSRRAHFDDPYQRVHQTVQFYSEPIQKSIRTEDAAVDVWFAVIPEYVYQNCRPRSSVRKDLAVSAPNKMDVTAAKRLRYQIPLFDEDETKARPYHYELNFHNQLKARLLQLNAPSQIVRETTLLSGAPLPDSERPSRDLEPPSAVAWNMSSAAFYKAGGRPWKIADIRSGVCYIGIVFKQDNSSADARSACCAAQMFLDHGDGVVFKGAVGPWYSPANGDYHLSREKARELIFLAMETYVEKQNAAPRELFIHGRVRFNTEEWIGFTEAVPKSTNLVGVRIRGTNELKLFRKGTHPILRGLSYIRDERTAYLWTKGFIPRLETYPGWEVPNPLIIDVCRGEMDIRTVLQDILALTKLNYNSCKFSDGIPVTLRFANAVGEILTSGPAADVPPLPFKHYI
jgi:hypothetical protein